MKLQLFYRKHVGPYVADPWFGGILLLKIAAAFIFADAVMREGFIPFLRYFVESGFSNPYDHFSQIGELKAFPYGSVMLWIFAIPHAVFSFLLGGAAGPLHLFITRIPVLLADIGIYLVLCRWLPSREKKILAFYWASPILFYVSYIHGQLDAVPTALLFISLAALFSKRTVAAFLLLGLSIAAKMHLLAALPFFVIYLFAVRTPFKTALPALFSAPIAYGLVQLPYLFSNGFREMVLKAGEQGWILLVSLDFPSRTVSLLIGPLLYAGLLLHFSTFRRVTHDLFIMVLALMFAMIIMLVPPMPGWIFWSLPLLAYFYAKKPLAPERNFWILSAAALLFFLVERSPSLAAAPLIKNLVFTAFEACLLLNAWWCYSVGIHQDFSYRKKPLLIGIGGNSGSGKSRLTELLSQLFAEKDVVCIHGDDGHRWPRGHENWEVFTHLNPASNKLHADLGDAIALRAGSPITRVRYDHRTGAFTEPQNVDPGAVIIFEGLHSFWLKEARSLFDVKLFLEPSEELRMHWKLKRDSQERGHREEEIRAREAARAPDSEKFIQPQRRSADLIIAFRPLTGIASSEQLGVTFELENSWNVEPLLSALSEIKSLHVDFEYQDVDRARVTVYGSVGADEIRALAFSLESNLLELTHADPRFAPDLDGVVQLFFLYFLSQKNKLKEVYG